MRTCAAVLAAVLVAGVVDAEVLVFVEDVDGLARVRYECTAGETVRMFSLDVSVGQGQITGVSDFFAGLCTPETQGYGVFPASFRDHVTVLSGTEATWDAEGYNPVADPADAPEDTLPGLDSAGVTLELGALWDPSDLRTLPGSTGTLCALQISEAAEVTVAANATRGAVIGSDGEPIADTVFTGASVAPPVPAITSVSVDGDTITIQFENGELETAPTVDGTWTGTGNTTGEHSESIAGVDARFYRVRGL